MVFAVGPAGTVKRIPELRWQLALKETSKTYYLTRPAVEAGENLGFLPGDMKKIRSLHAALYDALRICYLMKN
jgi:phosphate starvation-inducible protein PhoH